MSPLVDGGVLLPSVGAVSPLVGGAPLLAVGAASPLVPSPGEAAPASPTAANKDQGQSPRNVDLLT